MCIFIYRPSYTGVKTWGKENGNYFAVVFLICLIFGAEGRNGSEQLFAQAHNAFRSDRFSWTGHFCFVVCKKTTHRPNTTVRSLEILFLHISPLDSSGCKSLKSQLYTGLLLTKICCVFGCPTYQRLGDPVSTGIIKLIMKQSTLSARVSQT